MNDRPTPAQLAEWVAALDDMLDEDERVRDEQIGDELRAMGAEAHETTMAMLDRAKSIKAMRAAKAQRHVVGRTRADGTRKAVNCGPRDLPPLGRQAMELMSWLVDDLNASIEMIKEHTS